MDAHRAGSRAPNLSVGEFLGSCRGRATAQERRDAYLAAVGFELGSDPEARVSNAAPARAPELDALIALIQNQHRLGLRRCREQAQHWLIPTLSVVRYALELTADGRVTNVVSRFDPDDAFDLCARNALRTVSLPTRAHALSLEYAVETLEPSDREPAGIAKEVLVAVAAAHVDDLSACFGTWLATDSAAHGVLTMEWVVAPDGSVERAAVHGDVPPALRDVGCCLANRIETWHFPASKGFVTVMYPVGLRQAR
jgi:hypothetical protein